MTLGMLQRAKRQPALGILWLHEIKHDRFASWPDAMRQMLRRSFVAVATSQTDRRLPRSAGQASTDEGPGTALIGVR